MRFGVKPLRFQPVEAKAARVPQGQPLCVAGAARLRSRGGCGVGLRAAPFDAAEPSQNNAHKPVVGLRSPLFPRAPRTVPRAPLQARCRSRCHQLLGPGSRPRGCQTLFLTRPTMARERRCCGSGGMPDPRGALAPGDPCVATGRLGCCAETFVSPLLLAPLKTGDCNWSPPKQHTCLTVLLREEAPDWREVILGREK